jgi:hypothetical protein
MDRECKAFFFGDSICFGQGVSPHQVWVARIAADLAATFADAAITVQNPSVNGNTTRAALERMPYGQSARDHPSWAVVRRKGGIARGQSSIDAQQRQASSREYYLRAIKSALQ